ncbi:MAG: hypothetical protein ACFE9D_01235 [Promethearchaeota archaeon]
MPIDFNDPRIKVKELRGEGNLKQEYWYYWIEMDHAHFSCKPDGTVINEYLQVPFSQRLTKKQIQRFSMFEYWPGITNPVDLDPDIIIEAELEHYLEKICRFRLTDWLSYFKDHWEVYYRTIQELYELVYGVPCDHHPIISPKEYILQKAQSELPSEEFRIFNLWATGSQQQQIAEQLKKSIGYVNTRLRRIREGPMGFWYEDFVKGEGHRSGHGEPDFIAKDGVPVNLKCVGDKRTSKIKRDKLAPEIMYAKTHTASVRVQVYNIVHDQEQVLEFPPLEIPIEVQVNW